MSLSLYEITVPVMTAGFRSMSIFLDRGRTFANEKGIADAKLLNARLADDMMTLVQQVQRASDTARLAAVRVGRVENIAMPDRETTFDDLQARISATVSFLVATILGSTGSVAVSTLDVVERFRDRFRVVAMAAGSNLELLVKQIERHRPELVSVATVAAKEPSYSQPEEDLLAVW